jgi:hypothetical protein
VGGSKGCNLFPRASGDDDVHNFGLNILHRFHKMYYTTTIVAMSR